MFSISFMKDIVKTGKFVYFAVDGTSQVLVSLARKGFFDHILGRIIHMTVRETVINNKVGLFARPATFFIQKANEFKCSIWVEKDDRRVNAKSLLGVLSMGIMDGTTISLIADGVDEAEALDALAKLVSSEHAE